jgi:hypothetical protein
MVVMAYDFSSQAVFFFVSYFMSVVVLSKVGSG